jgi:hypothetical protein
MSDFRAKQKLASGFSSRSGVQLSWTRVSAFLQSVGPTSKQATTASLYIFSYSSVSTLLPFDTRPMEYRQFKKGMEQTCS